MRLGILYYKIESMDEIIQLSFSIENKAFKIVVSPDVTVTHVIRFRGIFQKPEFILVELWADSVSLENMLHSKMLNEVSFDSTRSSSPRRLLFAWVISDSWLDSCYSILFFSNSNRVSSGIVLN